MFAISLLSLHLFNLAGFRVVFDSLEDQSDKQLVDRLDQEGYRSDELIELKVPVNLPYHANWSNFERYDGEIDIDGIHYNYVSRKMVNDTLILLAIPNPDKTRIRHARETFYALVNDVQEMDGGDTSSGVPTSPRKVFTFEGVELPLTPHAGMVCRPTELLSADAASCISAGHPNVAEPPPDSDC